MSKIMELADKYAESIVTLMGTPRTWNDDYQRAISGKVEARAALAAEVEKLEAQQDLVMRGVELARLDLIAERDALREKLDAVVEDAERYRWLRKKLVELSFSDTLIAALCKDQSELDAAMEASK